MAGEAGHRTVSTYELLEQSVTAALDLQRDDGSFPPGQNGVYDESETPVRTTSHWLNTLAHVYELTGDETFANSAIAAADYLLGEEARPHGYTFHSRNEGQDRCDGLVGQSPAIRSLANVGAILDRPEIKAAAEEVFMLHPFDDRLGIWERVEIDGRRLSFDRTLNHQIHFASAGAYLADDEIDRMIRQFLEKLSDTLRTYRNGLIKHFLRPPPILVLKTLSSDRSRWNLLWNEIMFHYYSRSRDHRRKETGYHVVNLAALSHLKRQYPDHEFWTSDEIRRAIRYLDERSTDGNVNYGSLLPGIQTAIALHVLDDQPVEEVKTFVASDLESKFDFESNLMVNDTVDPMYQAASIVHLTILPDLYVSI